MLACCPLAAATGWCGRALASPTTRVSHESRGHPQTRPQAGRGADSAAMPREITAFSNPLVKRVRSLRDKRHRRAEGLFLAEGLRILTEAREAGRIARNICSSPRDGARHPLVGSADRRRSRRPAARRSRPMPDILSKLSGKDNPQAVVGVFAEFDDRARPNSTARPSPIWLVAERLRDPGNLGTILRTGDAVGAGGLILIDDCVDPFSVEAVRASMGALFTVPIVQARWDEFLAWLRAGPGQLVGLSLADRHRLSRGALRRADLPADRQRSAGHARRL